MVRVALRWVFPLRPSPRRGETIYDLPFTVPRS